MKFVCEQKKLTKALNIVSKAVSSRTTIPVLRGILIEAEEGKVIFSASDQSISIRTEMEADVLETGTVVVMAKLFGDIVRRLPGIEVKIESDRDFKVKISSMSAVFGINGISADEFPIVNNISFLTDSITFDKEVLKKMIDKTAFAASIDEARGVITGVLLELRDGYLSMVAIDGFRMAINRRAMQTEADHEFIIPAKILTELGKLIQESEGEEASLYLSGKKAVFRFDKIQAELNLIEGKFIPYKNILPQGGRINVRADREVLMAAIERASILSSAGRNNLVRLDIMDGVIEITSQSEEGNVKEDVAIVKEGDDLSIGFNSHYMMDVLKVIDDDEIHMAFNSAVESCLVLPIEGDDYEYLIQPVRLN